jgi:hypothetical protein
MQFEDEMMQEAFNFHERAEADACNAIRKRLEAAPLEALMRLADPNVPWETRSHMSIWIVDAADDLLSEKLEALVA